jgi:choline dehydrogenase-like flavoprotein
MPGGAKNPKLFDGAMGSRSNSKIGNGWFDATTVAIYFREENVTKKDPYFVGMGPERTGCHQQHIFLGGATMGENSTEGVDKNNKIFRYKNLYIIDSSMISANLGVNLSLSITAIANVLWIKFLLKTLRFLMKITVINQRWI